MVLRGSNGTFSEKHWDEKDLGQTRVLLVEDDPKALEILSWLLVMQGAEVLGVASVEAALGVFESFDPHVLVSDLNLTDATGFELVRALRGRGADIPAIAISSELGDGLEVLARGFQVGLQKPVSSEELTSAVGRLTAHLHQA
jgi:two-component system response regulator GlrR